MKQTWTKMMVPLEKTSVFANIPFRLSYLFWHRGPNFHEGILKVLFAYSDVRHRARSVSVTWVQQQTHILVKE